MISQLGIFQAYNFYHSKASEVKLTNAESNFFQYCMDNHCEICDTENDLSIEIQTQASKLYDEIMAEYFLTFH